MSQDTSRVKFREFSTKIDGMKAAHAIITSNCRKKGPIAAFDEAVERLREQYEMILCRNDTARRHGDFHIALTIDKGHLWKQD